VKDTPVETVAEALREHGGTLYHTSFSDEAAEAFRQAAASDELKEAVADLNEVSPTA